MLVAVQHLLWQTVDLLRAAAEMGLKLQNVFALGKVYSNNDLIIRTLRNLGATVIDSTVPAPGEFAECFERDIRLLWQVVQSALARERGVRRILILDDGGECITNVPTDLLRQYAMAGVEQTSRGMLVFQEKPPPFAVISWARTAVKLNFGGPLFSHCLLDKLNTHFLGGTRLQGAEVGILGMGSIGTGLTNLARRQGNDVVFYDPDPHLEVPPDLGNNITRLNSLEELMLRCDYVFGCSGRNPFRDRWPMAHRPGIKLFSASGGDQEFGPIIQDLKRGPSFKVVTDTWDITSDDGPSGPIHIAYLGYPYNFVSRGAEAVPTRIVQLETGGLLASLIQARNHLALCERGKELNRGIHRLAPAAQRFVLERWLETIAVRRIDVRDLYAYDTAKLEDATNNSWFIDNTEPHPGTDYVPSRHAEESMNRIVDPQNKLSFGGPSQL